MPKTALSYIGVDNINSTEYVASKIVKATAANCWAIRGYNSKTSSQFIQVHDSATLPTDTAVPEDIITALPESNFLIEYPKGKNFANGIVVCNSSTGPTKTIGSADCWFSAEFE